MHDIDEIVGPSGVDRPVQIGGGFVTSAYVLSFGSVRYDPAQGGRCVYPLSPAPVWASRHAAALARRCEVSGETAFCYTDDAAPLLAHLAHQSGLRTLHRPANLEDVFLKLTGRELRD